MSKTRAELVTKTPAMSELRIGESKKEASKKSGKKGRKEGKEGRKKERSPNKICNRTKNTKNWNFPSVAF
jgi:hypothetical protein